MFLSLRHKAGDWITFLLCSVAVVFAIPAHAVQARPKCCVWRVTNAKAAFYLVGSVHTLGEDDYPLPAPYEIALKDAKRLLFEFDPTRQAEFEKKLNAAARYRPGEDIRSKIDPKLFRPAMAILAAERNPSGTVLTADLATNRGGSLNISLTRTLTAVSLRVLVWMTISSCAPKRWEKR